MWRKIDNSRNGTMNQPARPCQAGWLRKKGNIRPKWGFQRQEFGIDRTIGKDAGLSVVAILTCGGLSGYCHSPMRQKTRQCRLSKRGAFCGGKQPGHIGSFQLEELYLCADAPGIARKAAVCAHDPMAGDNNGDGIVAHGPAHGLA